MTIFGFDLAGCLPAGMRAYLRACCVRTACVSAYLRSELSFHWASHHTVSAATGTGS